MNERRGNSNIIIIVIAVILLLGGSFLGYYLYTENDKVSKEYSINNSRLKKIEQQLMTIPDLDAELLNLKEKENSLISYVPDREGQAQFVKDLQQLASNNRLEIISCESKDSSKVKFKVPNYYTHRWNIKMLGEYQKYIEFMNALPTTSQVLLIDELSVSNKYKSADEKSKNKLDIQLTIDLISKSTNEKVKENGTRKQKR